LKVKRVVGTYPPCFNQLKNINMAKIILIIMIVVGVFLTYKEWKDD